MNKFLVIQTSFIGDAILSTALLEKLHQKYPDDQIDLVVRKGNEGLFDNHPYLRNCWVWDKKKKYKSLFSIIKMIRKERYDYVINLQRFGSSGLMTAFSKGKTKVGFKKNPFSFLFDKKFDHEIGNGTHETERNQKLIAFLTDPEPAKPKLYPPEEAFKKHEKIAQKEYYCLAPKSVWKTKELPREKWLELVNDLPENAKLIFIGGPADKEFCIQLCQDTQHENLEVRCGEDSLLESTALMAKAKMNFVNDSAPLHLASAVDAPVTAFFCSTIPEFGFTPTSTTHKVIETDEKLECRPCGLHGKKECPLGHFKCGHSINISKAISFALEQKMNQN